MKQNLKKNKIKKLEILKKRQELLCIFNLQFRNNKNNLIYEKFDNISELKEVSNRLNEILIEVNDKNNDTKPLRFFKNKKEEIEKIIAPINNYVRNLDIKQSIKKMLYSNYIILEVIEQLLQNLIICQI